MPRILAPLLVILWAAADLRAGDAAPNATAGDRYVALYRRILADADSQPKHSPLDQASLAEAAVRLQLRTGDREFGATAKRWLDAALANPKLDLKDFHVQHTFGRAVRLLGRQGVLDEAEHKRIGPLAAAQLQLFVDSTDDTDNNIRLAQVVGYANLLQYAETARAAPADLLAKVHARIDQYWRKIAAAGDLDEDAANYDSLGACFFVSLAQTLGREDELKSSAGFRRMFERFREIVSPAGLIPEYGDSYFAYSDLRLDRIFLLEYAAKLYDDPTFLPAARMLWSVRPDKLPSVDGWFRALPLINLEPSSAEPKEPSAPPSLRTLRLSSNVLVADKLILRTGRGPGSAMAMLDLYASGSHAHPNKGPSIAYYEVDGVPLFHNLGRHRTRSAICGNLLWAMPALADPPFPGCFDRPDQWFTMRIPVELLTADPHDPMRHIVAPQLALRNYADRRVKEVWFDNLRLEGPAGVQLIDDFENPWRWNRHVPQWSDVVVSPDHTQGAGSERLSWARVPSDHLFRQLAAPVAEPFTREQYEYLKLDVKYTGAKPYMHVRGLGQQVDLGDQILVAPAPAAFAEQRGGDAHGRVRFRSYITPDSALSRSIILTAERTLVVHDLLTPGKSMDGWDAGQLWQLYEQLAKGDDWFCSDDDGAYVSSPGAPGLAAGEASNSAAPRAAKIATRRMLVKYAADDAVRIGEHEVRQDYYCPNPKGRKAERFFTTFSCRKLAAGMPVAFTQVVLPHDPAAGEPEAIAKRIKIETQPDRSVRVTIAGEKQGAVVIDVGEEAWRVER